MNQKDLEPKQKIEKIKYTISIYTIHYWNTIFFSCDQNNKQQFLQNQPNTKTVKNEDTLILPQVTIIKNLPDSNKPKEILLINRPQSLTIKVPNTTGSFNTKKNKMELKK